MQAPALSLSSARSLVHLMRHVSHKLLYQLYGIHSAADRQVGQLHRPPASARSFAPPCCPAIRLSCVRVKMIAAGHLKNMLRDEVPVTTLRETIAVGLQQATEEERRSIRGVLCSAMNGKMDVLQVVLDAVCKEVIALVDADGYSVLMAALAANSRDAVMAVVERMRKDELRLTHVAVFKSVYSGHNEKDVEDAVVSVMDPSAFAKVTMKEDALRIAVCCPRRTRYRAVEAALKHGPTMEERLEAGIERVRYIHAAARFAGLETLKQMHNLLPLLSDGSGRRGELVGYARGIDLAAYNVRSSDATVQLMMEYLAEQAGDGRVFDFCTPKLLLTMEMESSFKWLANRAPQLLEAACRHPESLSVLIAQTQNPAFLVEQMAKLVNQEALGSMMQQSQHLTWQRRASIRWRKMLKPIHEAAPECMDDLKWKWLVEAIEDKAYEDVEYMLGMCTREHLAMRNDKGDTAYDMATRDARFPKKLLEGLKVVHISKRADS